jgi:hypothetical protein
LRGDREFCALRCRSNYCEQVAIQVLSAKDSLVTGGLPTMRITTIFAHNLALFTLVAIASPTPAQVQKTAAARHAAPSRGAALAEGRAPVYSTSAHPTSHYSTSVNPGFPKRSLPDFNRDIFYKNKLEYSVETGWLPNNIPFVFDFVVGSKYTTWPLHYTLVPNLLSVRWQLDNIWGWKVFRGNTDFSFSGSYTAIPRGAETRYFAYDYGIRRYFIPPRSRVVPYVEGRGGIGTINAKGPHGVEYAQGQNMTFTLMVGSGARYSFSPRYGVSAGATYMHVSNFYLSEPRYEDFGINVWGAMAGFYMRIGKAKPTIVR